MKTLKGVIIPKPTNNALNEVLAIGLQKIACIAFLLRNFGNDFKEWHNMGSWTVRLPCQNIRGWMAVDYAVSSLEDYNEICRMADALCKEIGDDEG